MKPIAKTLLITITVSIAGNLLATTIIPDRATLNSILGGGGVAETFENYPIDAGQAAVDVSVNTLDSSTTFLGQGPGLVIPGFALKGEIGPSFLQWSGDGYFGMPTRTVDMGGGQSETIDFTSPVQTFGVDLLAFSGYGATATAVIYGADDTTVLTTISGISIGGGSSIAFLGASDSGGIGKVVLSQSGPFVTWSPIIDNLTFGSNASVPDTGATLLLMGLALSGLAAFRRMT